MKVTITTAGSRGDVQPYIALGEGLKKAGFQVRIATHENFRELVEERELELAVIHGNPQEILDSEEGRKLLESGNNPLKAIKKLAEMMNPLVEEVIRDTWKACQGSDFIIYTPTMDAGYYAAEKLEIPAIYTMLQPLLRTQYFSGVEAPKFLSFLKGPINWLSYIAVEQLLWQPTRKSSNRYRKEIMELPPLPFFGSSNVIYKKIPSYKYSPIPALCAFSPSVIQEPPDWHEWMQITGYWFLEVHEQWNPPSKLTDFIEAGSPPVYIGFGSMNNRNPHETAEIVMKALKKSQQRGILLTGWGGLKSSDSTDDILFIEAAPHDWLFPRMGAVVHHGGAGTTAAGFRAGVPSIIIPFFGDQPFWARTATNLKVGPHGIPRQDLNTDNLAHAISEAINNENIRNNAAALGKKIKGENGVKTTVEIIRNYLARIN